MDERVAPELQVRPDLATAAGALAARIAEEARRSIQARGRFSLVVSGGSTPAPLFGALRAGAHPPVDWSKADLFWADERCVAPEDARSNYALAAQHLLPLAGLPPRRIHRIRGELSSPDDAAAVYEREIVRFRRDVDDPAGSFDVTVLGVGPDGHTASLFPGADSLSETDHEVTVESHPAREPLVPRITLTLPALNRSKVVAFLADGAEKAEVIRRVLRPAAGEPLLPAARVQGARATWWYLDGAAAALVR